MTISNSYKLFFQLCLTSHKRTLIRNVVPVSPDNLQTTNSFHLMYFQQNNKDLQSLWLIINWIPTKRDQCICEHFLPQMSRRYQWGRIFMSVSFNLWVCCVCCFFCKHLTTCFTEIAFAENNMTGIWIHSRNTQRRRYYRRSQARVLKRPRLHLDPVNHHTHAHTLNPTCFFVIDWTLRAPNLPILVIEFGGRDVLLQLSGRLSLTVGFFLSDIIPIVNYWLSTVSPTLFHPLL